MELRECTDRNQWDKFALKHHGHPLQLWGWGEVKLRHGWSVRRFAIANGDQLVAGAQVLIKKLPWPLNGFAYIPRGPVGEDETLLDELAFHVKKQLGVSVMSVEPGVENMQIPDGWRKTQNTILPAQTIRLDLRKTADELQSVMAKKTRQYIRKSAGDVRIRLIKNSEELEQCLALYHETARRARFDLHDDDYYRDVYEHLGEHSPIFAAFSRENMVAFLWLAISEETAFELYGGVTEVGQALRANYALKWHAIEKTKEWGIHYYDFGGLIGDGVSNFKRGWAEGDTEYVGTYEKPLSVFYGVWDRALPIAKKATRKVKKLGKR